MPSRPSFRRRASQPQLIRFRRRAFFEPLEDRRMMAIVSIINDLEALGAELNEHVDDFETFELEFKKGIAELVLADGFKFLSDNNPVPEAITEFLDMEIDVPGLNDLLDIAGIPRSVSDALTVFAASQGHPELGDAIENLEMFINLNNWRDELMTFVDEATNVAEFDDLIDDIKAEFGDITVPFIDEFNQLRDAAGANTAALTNLAEEVVEFLDTQASDFFTKLSFFNFEVRHDVTATLYETDRIPIPGFGAGVGPVSGGATVGFSIDGLVNFAIAGGINLTSGLTFTEGSLDVGVKVGGDGSIGIRIGSLSLDAATLEVSLSGIVGADLVDSDGSGSIDANDFLQSCFFATEGGLYFNADAEYIDVLKSLFSFSEKKRTVNIYSTPVWEAAGASCDPSLNPLAGPGAIQDGILHVEGTSGPDTITISLDTTDPASPKYVVEKTTEEETFTGSFNAAGITQIHVRAKAGEDVIEVAEAITIATMLDGGSDNDTILGGGGPDQILGGDGDDTIDGRLGDDYIRGDAHNDILTSSAGADIIEGNDDLDQFFITPDLQWAMDILGGSPGATDTGVPPGDILAVDLTHVAGGQIPRNVRSGAIGSLTHKPIIFSNIETLIGSDAFEINNQREIATDLGSDPLIVLRDLSIHDEFDVDYFTFTAHQTGHATIEARFHHVIGDLDLYVYDSAGNLILDELSTDDNELAVMPVVEGERYFVRVRGFADAVNNYTLEIVNFVVPVPSQVDLQWASDTGRHDSDDLTSDTTTTFDIHLDDSVLVGLGLTRDDDFDVQVFNNGVLLGEATHISNQRWVFTTATGDLEPGSDNFISAAVLVRDLADAQATGRGELSTSLQVTLDTVDPTVTFGLLGSTIDGLEGTSDTGVATQALTLSDRITSDAMPTFYGRADANAHIRLLLVTDDNGTADPSDDAVVELGAGLATLADGNGAYPDGNWSITSSIDLNAVSLGLPLDGPRLLRVVAEDAAGNVSDVDDLRIVLDTQGPRIASVLRVDGANVFEPTPLNPTPLVHAIDVTFFDRRPPGTVHAAANLALLTNPASYRVVGDANGQVLVATAVVQSQGAVTIDGIAGTAVTVRLTFSAPLPDDRLTVTVLDVIQDDAGNALDGESHAASPGGASGQLPSGDGAVGGSFVGRFTVDSRPEFGVWAGGSVYVDTNGNFNYDPENADDTNEDITYHFGLASDLLLSGNFSATAAATADGFDKLAAYGRVGTRYRWLVDTDNDGVADLSVIQDVPPGATSVAGVPVAGNFDGDATNGDEVGLKVGNVWWLDTNHDFKVDTRLAGSNMVGLPIVGDFDGDGVDDLGAWADDTFSLNLSLSGPIDGAVDRTFAFGFPGVGERPIAGDFDGDTITDIGLWVPERSGPGSAGEWFVLVSAGRTIQQRMAGGIAFSPSPLGSDLFGQFGNSFGIPLFGNFDPPLTPPTGDNPGTDIRNNLDTNGDGYVTPLDALIVINALNLSAAAGQEPSGDVDPLLDTNGDSAITPLDALIVINWLNAELTPSGGSSGEAAEGEALDVEFGGAAEIDDDLLLALALDGAEAKKRR